MQKLEELIAALEKAEGPDRWLDANIYMLAHGQTMKIFGGNIVSNEHGVIGWLDPGKENVNFTLSGVGEQIPRYTESIDAAVALIARALPNANCWGIDKDERGLESHIQCNGVATGHWAQFAEHPTSPAIALCIAALRAKLSQEKNNADK